MPLDSYHHLGLGSKYLSLGSFLRCFQFITNHIYSRVGGYLVLVDVVLDVGIP